MKNLVTKAQRVPMENVPVFWAAQGEHVFKTSIKDFEKAVQEAKNKEESRKNKELAVL